MAAHARRNCDSTREEICGRSVIDDEGLYSGESKSSTLLISSSTNEACFYKAVSGLGLVVTGCELGWSSPLSRGQTRMETHPFEG